VLCFLRSQCFITRSFAASLSETKFLRFPGQLNGRLNICYANAANSMLAVSPLFEFLASCCPCVRCSPGTCPLKIMQRYFEQLRYSATGHGNVDALDTPDVFIDVLEPALRTRISRNDKLFGPHHDPDEYLLRLIVSFINEHCGYNNGDPYPAAFHGMRVFSDHLTEFLQTTTATALCAGPCKSNANYTSMLVAYEGVIQLHIDEVDSVKTALDAYVFNESIVNVECSACKACKPSAKVLLPAKTRRVISRPPLCLLINLKRFKQTATDDWEKDSRHISFPATFDLSEYFGILPDDSIAKTALINAGFSVEGGVVCATTFELAGMTEHLGRSKRSGHHRGFTKLRVDGENMWLMRDGTSVSSVSLEFVLGQQAQMLMYTASQPEIIKSLRKQENCLDGTSRAGACIPPPIPLFVAASGSAIDRDEPEDAPISSLKPQKRRREATVAVANDSTSASALASNASRHRDESAAGRLHLVRGGAAPSAVSLDDESGAFAGCCVHVNISITSHTNVTECSCRLGYPRHGNRWQH
jgi:hypothetical protein